uniref:Uncharacterized protein n=1 Tax=viral metagenome TaxID=1070528 RepID=A0A2V0RL57_9ZZZZ
MDKFETEYGALYPSEDGAVSILFYYQPESVTEFHGRLEFFLRTGGPAMDMSGLTEIDLVERAISETKSFAYQHYDDDAEKVIGMLNSEMDRFREMYSVQDYIGFETIIPFGNPEFRMIVSERLAGSGPADEPGDGSEDTDPVSEDVTSVEGAPLPDGDGAAEHDEDEESEVYETMSEEEGDKATFFVLADLDAVPVPEIATTTPEVTTPPSSPLSAISPKLSDMLTGFSSPSLSVIQRMISGELLDLSTRVKVFSGLMKRFPLNERPEYPDDITGDDTLAASRIIDIRGRIAMHNKDVEDILEGRKTFDLKRLGDLSLLIKKAKADLVETKKAAIKKRKPGALYALLAASGGSVEEEGTVSQEDYQYFLDEFVSPYAAREPLIVMEDQKEPTAEALYMNALAAGQSAFRADLRSAVGPVGFERDILPDVVIPKDVGERLVRQALSSLTHYTADSALSYQIKFFNKCITACVDPMIWTAMTGGVVGTYVSRLVDRWIDKGYKSLLIHDFDDIYRQSSPTDFPHILLSDVQPMIMDYSRPMKGSTTAATDESKKKKPASEGYFEKESGKGKGGKGVKVSKPFKKK